jgi:hypothetical protein
MPGTFIDPEFRLSRQDGSSPDLEEIAGAYVVPAAHAPDHTNHARLQYPRLSLFTGFPAASTRSSTTDKNACAASVDLSKANERMMRVMRR